MEVNISLSFHRRKHTCGRLIEDGDAEMEKKTCAKCERTGQTKSEEEADPQRDARKEKRGLIPNH